MSQSRSDDAGLNRWSSRHWTVMSFAISSTDLRRRRSRWTARRAGSRSPSDDGAAHSAASGLVACRGIQQGGPRNLPSHSAGAAQRPMSRWTTGSAAGLRRRMSRHSRRLPRLRMGNGPSTGGHAGLPGLRVRAFVLRARVRTWNPRRAARQGSEKQAQTAAQPPKNRISLPAVAGSVLRDASDAEHELDPRRGNGARPR